MAASSLASQSNIICHLPSGQVELCMMQFLRGYCILRAEPVVASINALDEAPRTAFLKDMVRVGDAIMQITGAYRINYGVFGNSDPVLHAHIVPRYLTEPDAYRHGYSALYSDPVLFLIPYSS